MCQKCLTIFSIFIQSHFLPSAGKAKISLILISEKISTLSFFAFSIYSLLHCATILVLQRAVVKPQFYLFICQRVRPKMFRRHCGSSAARCWIKNGLAVETNKQLRQKPPEKTLRLKSRNKKTPHLPWPRIKGCQNGENYQQRRAGPDGKNFLK